MQDCVLRFVSVVLFVGGGRCTHWWVFSYQSFPSLKLPFSWAHAAADVPWDENLVDRLAAHL